MGPGAIVLSESSPSGGVPAGGRPASADRRLASFLIERSRPGTFKPHQLDKRGRIDPPQKLTFLISKTGQVFLGQINSSSIRVDGQVSQDVGELEREPQVNGVVGRMSGTGAEDLQADQSDHGGYAITVAV